MSNSETLTASFTIDSSVGRVTGTVLSSALGVACAPDGTSFSFNTDGFIDFDLDPDRFAASDTYGATIYPASRDRQLRHGRGDRRAGATEHRRQDRRYRAERVFADQGLFGVQFQQGAFSTPGFDEGFASAPTNVAPVLHVNGGVISWSADRGATTFRGAISTAPRNAAGRKTTYTDLGLVTSWTPATPPCGTTRYYGVASEGQAGEQWTANEVAIAGPACPPPPIENVAPILTYKLAPIGDREPALVWPQDPGATSYKAAICTAARGAPGRSCAYINNIGSPGDPFDVGEPEGQMYWDLLGNSVTDPRAAPCGTHWFSIASEGPAGELWAAQEYEFGPESGGYGLPACPPPEATGPPVG